MIDALQDLRTVAIVALAAVGTAYAGWRTKAKSAKRVDSLAGRAEAPAGV